MYALYDNNEEQFVDHDLFETLDEAKEFASDYAEDSDSLADVTIYQVLPIVHGKETCQIVWTRAVGKALK